MTASKCRFCGQPLTRTFADLGMSPLANSFVPRESSGAVERFYPLRAFVCDGCRLVQLEQFEPPERIFSNYLYFSSFSESWLRHAEAYTLQMIERFNLGSGSKVVEIGSNDGYLLQYFHQRGISVLGIEPAANVASKAVAKGVRTEVTFFGSTTASRLRADGTAPDLIAANNVLAHIPDINDFVIGLKTLVNSDGIITVEFPHLLRLIAENQFDTIYHEHFSYLSLHVVRRLFARHGLRLFDVEELSTHGGSLRIYACHNDGRHSTTSAISAMLEREADAGLESSELYVRFARQVIETKCALLEFLIGAKRGGKSIAAYGAPAKGNTLLNYCGIGADFVDFTVDRSPHKQGLLLPGTRIPIRAPEAIFAAKPSYVLILCWNLKDEVMAQMAGIRSWGGRFVVPIPKVQFVQ